MQYSLSVKQEEKKRLEEELRNEEIILQKMESELRLAEQAFDQFLQENDRKAVGAMKRWVLWRDEWSWDCKEALGFQSV